MTADPPASLLAEDLKRAPPDSAWTIPARWYSAPDLHAFELEHVFAPAWQLLGGGDLTEPGEYVAGEIAGMPAFAVRGRDGTLRAFHNVCRHRAGPVVRGRGQCNVLRCRYHGWLYRLDGTLHTAPEFAGTVDFDPAEVRLPELDLHHVPPLAFVRRQHERPPALDLPAALDELAGHIAPLTFSDLTFARRETYTVPCNWKVYVDNFLEGYHLPLVHPGLSRVLDYREYRTELFAGYCVQRSPIRSATGAYTEGDAFYYFLFPNIMLNVLPGRLQTNVVLPRGPDSCDVVFDYFYAGAADDDERAARIEADVEFADEVQAEDIDICADVQRGIASGSWTRGRLSAKREQGVRHFHDLLRAVCASALTAPSTRTHP